MGKRRLQIEQHFDNIVNKIDIATEEARAKVADDRLDSERQRELQVVQEVRDRAHKSGRALNKLRHDCLLFRNPKAAMGISVAIYPQHFDPKMTQHFDARLDKWDVPWLDLSWESRAIVGQIICDSIDKTSQLASLVEQLVMECMHENWRLREKYGPPAAEPNDKQVRSLADRIDGAKTRTEYEALAPDLTVFRRELTRLWEEFADDNKMETIHRKWMGRKITSIERELADALK